MPESRDKSEKYIVVSDQPTTKDSLGFTPYVIAIAEFLTSPDTKPPLTLSIEGEWGSGKSSFMKQLEAEIVRKSKEVEEKPLKDIENRMQNKRLLKIFPDFSKIPDFFEWLFVKSKLKLKQNTQIIEFNAWRHDKAESLWAAFALSFLEKISTNHSLSDILPNLLGNLKLFCHRFNWKEKPFKAIQTLAITSLIGSIIVAIPFVLLNVVKTSGGFQEWSEDVVCLLKEESTKEESTEDDGEDLKQSDQQTSNKCSENQFLTLFIRWLLIIGGTGGGVAGIGKLLATLRDLIGDSKMDLTQYLESPDYDKQVAFIEKFHDDFSKIVDAYVGKDEKIYVFIDDLDRCELGKSADLLQALNLMISSDPNIIFILGMDREKVAAGITFKQKDVLPYLDSISGDNQGSEKEKYQLMKKLDYGFNFMEKFIQLTFSVPKPSEKTLDIFLKKLSSVEEQETLTQDTSPTTTQKEFSIYPLIEKDLNQSDLENLVKMVAPFLDYNPRRLKQYINVLKLRIYITYYSIGVTFNERNSLMTIEQLGKFVAIPLKYPRLILHLEDDNELLGKLEKYACSQSSSSNNSHDSQNWFPINNQRTENEKNVEHWVNKDSQLKNLLCYKATEERYSLVKDKGIKKLLEVSQPAIDTKYYELRKLLSQQKWKEANEETKKVMCKVAEIDKLDKKSIDNFPCKDLQIIDQLWVGYSENKFGFSVQKRIYTNLEENQPDKERLFWDMLEEVGWRILIERGRNPGYVWSQVESWKKGFLPLLSENIGRLPNEEGQLQLPNEEGQLQWAILSNRCVTVDGLGLNSSR